MVNSNMGKMITMKWYVIPVWKKHPSYGITLRNFQVVLNCIKQFNPKSSNFNF